MSAPSGTPVTGSCCSSVEGTVVSSLNCGPRPGQSNWHPCSLMLRHDRDNRKAISHCLRDMVRYNRRGSLKRGSENPLHTHCCAGAVRLAHAGPTVNYWANACAMASSVAQRTPCTTHASSDD